jgi:hypothetical protein
MAQVQIGIQTGFQPQGTDAAKQALANVGQQATKAEKELLSYANAQARLARATGDNRGAANIYAQALNQVNKNSQQGVQAQAQLQQAVGRVNKELTGGAGLAQQFGGAMKGEILGLIGPAALAAAAIAGIGEAFELAKIGARAELVDMRFQKLATSAGTTGDAILNALRTASGGEISDLNLQLTANQALLLGVADSAQEFSTLMAIARDRAQAMGISTEDAFNRIVLGIGKAEPELLDELGLVISATEANKRYAASLGISEQALTKQQRSQALADEVLRQGKTILDETGGAVETNASKIARGAAAWDNLKTTFGGFLAISAGPAAQNAADLLSFNQGEQGFRNFQIGLVNLQRQLAFLPPLTAAQEAAMRGVADAGDTVAAAIDRAVTASTAKASVDDAEINRITYLKGLDEQRTESLRQQRDATDNLVTALGKQTIETSAAAVEAEKLKNFQSDLAGISEQVRGGLISSGEGALILADRYGIAIGEARTLIALNSQLAGIKTPVEAARARGREGGLSDRTGTDTSKKPASKEFLEGVERHNQEAAAAAKTAAEEAAAEAKRIADAQFQYELSAAKTTADKIALYKKRLAQTTDKAERLNLQTQINNLQNTGGRGKADPQARGLGALAQDRIDLAGTEQQQLAEVNRQLAATNLTEHQRNTLLEKRLKLEESIKDAILAQQQANVDAQLKTVQDAQARLKEAREAAGLNRALAGGKLTAEQQQAVGLRLQEIGLEQEKRRLDISGAETKAGGLTPINGGAIPQFAGAAGGPVPTGAPGAMPNPFVAPQAVPGAFSPVVASAPVTVNITLTVDSAGRVSATTGPGVLLNLLGAAHASNAGGGRG